MKFDHVDYVIDGHEYEFRCKNKGEFFPPNYNVSVIRLKCIGKEQHYIDQKTAQPFYKIARKCGPPKPKNA